EVASGAEENLFGSFLSVFASGEGGLLGLAVHPDFSRSPYIYAMQTYKGPAGVRNRIVRLRDEGDHGRFDRVIFDGLPGFTFHDGGRIGFGPDGMLYVATGETFKPELAQNLSSPAGKILRLTPDGGVPADNPFPNSPVYSYGHRNPQGLAWEPRSGTLFASEHGPTGEFGLSAYDEINVIRAGGNYGCRRARPRGADRSDLRLDGAGGATGGTRVPQRRPVRGDAGQRRPRPHQARAGQRELCRHCRRALVRPQSRRRRPRPPARRRRGS